MCGRLGEPSAPNDETRDYSLSRNFQASLPTENMARSNFHQPESLYLVGRPKTELSLEFTADPLRTFARNFSNIDFFLKILPLKDDELAMSEM